MNKKRSVQHSESAARARILAAARTRFRRYGYPKTAMQEIAAACGMSAANLYRHYEGKLAIGVAVATEDQAHLFALCDAATAIAPARPAPRLVALFHAVIDGTRAQMKTAPRLFELRLLVSRERARLRQDFLDGVERRIGAILDDENGPGRNRAHLVLLAAAPFVLPWMMQNTPFGDPRPQVEPLVRSLLGGLPSAPKTPRCTH